MYHRICGSVDRKKKKREKKWPKEKRPIEMCMLCEGNKEIKKIKKKKERKNGARPC